MSGDLLTLARKDAVFFVTKGGFEEEITLQTPSRDLTVNIKGYATKHHINFDSDGLPVNTKNVHISISEDELESLNYPVRNAKGEVFLKNHIVIYKDSTGLPKTYKIEQNLPDEVLGLIVCILSDLPI
jgi:hypothetical protein